MTLTRTRPEPTTAPTATPARTLNDVIPVGVALAVGILWVAMLGFVFSITPAPEGEPSAFAVTVSVIFELALIATLAGLVALRRWGLLASVGAAGIMLGMAALCSLGGHTGGWLVAQYVASGTLLVAGRAAYLQA